MTEQRTLQLAAALAFPATRAEAAQKFATHVGASALWMFVHDPAVDAFLPAPGFAQTLPSRAGWREFLSNAARASEYHGRVGDSTPGPPAPAVAFTSHSLMIVLVGGDVEPGPVETLLRVAPLVASCIRGEHEALVAQGELRAARAYAAQVETLARALDAARAEVERTVLSLEQQARETQDAKARAEEATRVKDEFLAMLGHELRNPLTPIVTAVHLLQVKQPSSRELDIIVRQVAALSRLVEDLLDVSRITTGKIDLRREPVELSDVLERAIEISGPFLERKSQTLTVRVEPAGLVLDADASRMAQVFANLLTNASKYSDAGTTIEVLAERDAARVRVRVKDEGIGLTPEMIDVVFDAFVQQRQSVDRAQGGLGLGLAIVRSLVGLHQGTVTAKSGGEGQGSEFVVDLPLAPADRHASAPTSATLLPAARSAPGARVMVVDDNDDTTAMLSAALTALGHVVRTAPDGPTALRVAVDFKPQVAILDIGLPVMDGYELAGLLLEADPRHPARLIALSGYGQPEDKARARDAGFHAHLVKPVEIVRLAQLVDQMVN